MWSEGETIYVLGTAVIPDYPLGSARQTHAILWTRPVPCPADCNHSGQVNCFDLLCFLNHMNSRC